MATLSRGATYGATETITNTKLHNLIDLGSVTGIVNADCDANMALADTKLANITTAGKVSGTSIYGLASLPSAISVELLKIVYPVGSVITLGVATAPATLFGFGTWAAIAGKVVVGIDSTQTEFDTLNETGGAKTHTLTTDEIPAHSHAEATLYKFFSETSPGPTIGGDGINNPLTPTTANAGGGGAHNNLQPYIVKYVWERTA
jgi:hypothetical protein